MRVSEAGPTALEDWDRHTVDVPGGNVYQSRAWAEHRARFGWQPRFLVYDDGFRLLSLERPWKLVGGSGAYLSRGPVSAGEPAERTADRLVAAAAHLAERGVDVISSDAEIGADTGYSARIEAAGFRPIEEVQPSRHRMALALPAGAEEPALMRAFSTATRQRVRHAERSGLRVMRWDARDPRPAGDGFERPPAAEDPWHGNAGATAGAAFDRFYALLLATAARRGFGLGSRAAFGDWSQAGLAAGHVVYLEVHSPEGELLGAATFYRHGGRLTYSHSGDRADLRHAHPGVIHLLLWRAIQLAVREGLSEVDLAGVDVPGSRREPSQGDPMYGLYSFKRSFGASWVELAGNHERVVRPVRYALGRLTGRLPLPRALGSMRAAATPLVADARSTAAPVNLDEGAGRP